MIKKWREESFLPTNSSIFCPYLYCLWAHISLVRVILEVIISKDQKCRGIQDGDQPVKISNFGLRLWKNSTFSRVGTKIFGISVLKSPNTRGYFLAPRWGWRNWTFWPHSHRSTWTVCRSEKTSSNESYFLAPKKGASQSDFTKHSSKLKTS